MATHLPFFFSAARRMTYPVGAKLTQIVYRYMGANIPGKPREQLIYLAGVDTYAKEIRNALDGWKGFNLKMAADEKKQETDIDAKVADLNLTQGVR
jgi:hypothetical protein